MEAGVIGRFIPDGTFYSTWFGWSGVHRCAPHEILRRDAVTAKNKGEER